MPDVPVPPVSEAVPSARPASAAPIPPVVIVVVPAGAVPAGSAVVLALSADALPDGAMPAAPALPPLPPYPPSVPGRRLTRKLREWNLAWWFAVAAAALEVPVAHVLAYYLHQHGLISPLEYWFPLG
ncbi:hypothetical protein ACFU9Y_30135 [Streptomyces sp. NPDC057621]|uniref:hypothetical protein n=1 Tax=Streptomyces sp. NPDC057621 TaxID=3346186 RepID=UPI00368E5537